MFADGKRNLEGLKFVKGVAASQRADRAANRPGWRRLGAAPATAETFAAADVYSTIEGVPARFRSQATWMAELSTLNGIDQFETTNGAKLFPFVGGSNPMLLRRPVVENSSVDPLSGLDPAATADHFLLYCGDFSHYVILDRVGMVVSFIQPGVLQNANAGLPDGRVAWYAYWRVGGATLDINAFRVMSIPTAA